MNCISQPNSTSYSITVPNYKKQQNRLTKILQKNIQKENNFNNQNTQVKTQINWN
jgi:hypothetical protein